MVELGGWNREVPVVMGCGFGERDMFVSLISKQVLEERKRDSVSPVDQIVMAPDCIFS